MIKNARKISIIGGCGTGKTTLSNNLGKELNIPVYHIDGITHLENWKKREKEECNKIILEKLNENKWIIDGNYHTTLELRLKNSDIAIYLDYSSLAQLKGILGRYIKKHGKEKEEIPGCKERLTLKFLLCTLNWRRNKRSQIIRDLNKIDENKILVFKNRRQLNKWYKKNFNKKIII